MRRRIGQERPLFHFVSHEADRPKQADKSQNHNADSALVRGLQVESGVSNVQHREEQQAKTVSQASSKLRSLTEPSDFAADIGRPEERIGFRSFADRAWLTALHISPNGNENTERFDQTSDLDLSIKAGNIA